MDIDELVVKYQNTRDDSAFSSIVSLLSRVIFKYAHKAAKELDEAVNDIRLIIWECAKKFKGGSFLGYCQQYLHYYVIDTYKKLNRHKNVGLISDTTVVDSVATHTDDPSLHAEVAHLWDKPTASYQGTNITRSREKLEGHIRGVRDQSGGLKWSERLLDKVANDMKTGVVNGYYKYTCEHVQVMLKHNYRKTKQVLKDVWGIDINEKSYYTAKKRCNNGCVYPIYNSLQTYIDDELGIQATPKQLTEALHRYNRRQHDKN